MVDMDDVVALTLAAAACSATEAGAEETLSMDKALGSDVEGLVWVFTWTRSSSELPNRLPQ